MNLAIFDLDNTLLDGDSDYAWGQFLVERNVVDRAGYESANRHYYEQYQQGVLDIYDFLEFALKPLTEHDRATLDQWHKEFMQKKIRPMITAQARELVEQHRNKNDTLLIITATNDFVTTPIAKEFAIDNLLATEPEMIDGHFTGKISGVPCFREGKVQRLQAWMKQQTQSFNATWFYTDSHNDLPLLELVDHPVAVNADDILLQHAKTEGWPLLALH